MIIDVRTDEDVAADPRILPASRRLPHPAECTVTAPKTHDGPYRPARDEKEQRIAAIDIGSNSIRLVIYEGLSHAPTVLFNEKVLCGLGRGVSKTGLLPEDGVRLALQSLRRRRVRLRVGARRLPRPPGRPRS